MHRSGTSVLTRLLNILGRSGCSRSVDSDGKACLVIFYEDLMDDCDRELQRLAEFLGQPERAQQIDVREAVRDFIDKGLQHHCASIAM